MDLCKEFKTVPAIVNVQWMFTVITIVVTKLPQKHSEEGIFIPVLGWGYWGKRIYQLVQVDTTSQ